MDFRMQEECMMLSSQMAPPGVGGTGPPQAGHTPLQHPNLHHHHPASSPSVQPASAPHISYEGRLSVLSNPAGYSAGGLQQNLPSHFQQGAQFAANLNFNLFNNAFKAGGGKDGPGGPDGGGANISFPFPLSRESSPSSSGSPRTSNDEHGHERHETPVKQPEDAEQTPEGPPGKSQLIRQLEDAEKSASRREQDLVKAEQMKKVINSLKELEGDKEAEEGEKKNNGWHSPEGESHAETSEPDIVDDKVRIVWKIPRIVTIWKRECM